MSFLSFRLLSRPTTGAHIDILLQSIHHHQQGFPDRTNNKYTGISFRLQAKICIASSFHSYPPSYLLLLHPSFRLHILDSTCNPPQCTMQRTFRALEVKTSQPTKFFDELVSTFSGSLLIRGRSLRAFAEDPRARQPGTFWSGLLKGLSSIQRYL